MGQVIRLQPREREAPDMLDALVDGMIEGFNRCVAVKRFDKAATRVMVGYLSAAGIALRCNGLEPAAVSFLAAAAAIERDWTSFEQSVRALAAELGRRS